MFFTRQYIVATASENGEMLLTARGDFVSDFADRLCAITHGYALCCKALHRKRCVVSVCLCTCMCVHDYAHIYVAFELWCCLCMASTILMTNWHSLTLSSTGFLLVPVTSCNPIQIC